MNGISFTPFYFYSKIGKLKEHFGSGKLDTLKLHLLRITLWRTSKYTNLIVLLNWTPWFHLVAFPSLQEENIEESPFQVPSRSWLVWSLLHNTLWFVNHTGKISLPLQRRLDSVRYSIALVLHICRIRNKAAWKRPFLPIFPLFIQHCRCSDTYSYKLVSSSWYAMWNIAHTHAYVWDVWVGTKAQAQNCSFPLYHRI